MCFPARKRKFVILIACFESKTEKRAWHGSVPWYCCEGSVKQNLSVLTSHSTSLAELPCRGADPPSVKLGLVGTELSFRSSYPASGEALCSTLQIRQ